MLVNLYWDTYVRSNKTTRKGKPKKSARRKAGSQVHRTIQSKCKWQKGPQKSGCKPAETRSGQKAATGSGGKLSSSQSSIPSRDKVQRPAAAA
eukprot:6186142-Pleurochrysis_carterae.AAC.3